MSNPATLAPLMEPTPIRPSIPCPLCDGTDAVLAGDRDRDGQALRVVACRGCGLVWNDPRPTAEELAAYYRKEYRQDYKGTVEPKPKHTFRAARVAVDRIREVRRHLKPGATVLDLGAGGGEVVYVLRRLGFDARGIEPNEGYARFARERLGQPVETGIWQEAAIPARSLDAVTLFHVLEHLDDPVGVLTLVRGWLRPGGLLWIEVPNIAARCIAPAHRFHRAHLFGFSPGSLAGIARRAGFDVVETGASADGGNVTAVLHRTETPVAGTFRNASNAESVLGVLQDHTALRHLLSTAPYVRPFRRISQAFTEFLATRGRPDPRDLLDRAIRAGMLVVTGLVAAEERGLGLA